MLIGGVKGAVRLLCYYSTLGLRLWMGEIVCSEEPILCYLFASFYLFSALYRSRFELDRTASHNHD